VAASVETPDGEAATERERIDEAIALSVGIPWNLPAFVRLPVGAARAVRHGADDPGEAVTRPISRHEFAT
jgi:hypothetical protein